MAHIWVPSLRSQRQVDQKVQGLQSELQDNQGYREKPCFKRKQKEMKERKLSLLEFSNCL